MFKGGGPKELKNQTQTSVLWIGSDRFEDYHRTGTVSTWSLLRRSYRVREWEHLDCFCFYFHQSTKRREPMGNNVTLKLWWVGKSMKTKINTQSVPLRQNTEENVWKYEGKGKKRCGSVRMDETRNRSQRPKWENQTDRSHKIGQTNRVKKSKLILFLRQFISQTDIPHDERGRKSNIPCDIVNNFIRPLSDLFIDLDSSVTTSVLKLFLMNP